MTEADLQQGVIQLARLFGYRVAHFRPAQTSKGWRTPVTADGKGFPDLVLAHPQRGVIFAELKTGRNKLSAEQTGWISVLEQAADVVSAGPLFAVYVWTPADWPDRITEVLSGYQVRTETR